MTVMRSLVWAAAVAFLAVFLTGCGGSPESSTQTYHSATSETGGYHNADGSPPQCVTLKHNEQTACNTDEELVLAARAINSGTETLEGLIAFYRGSCGNAGYAPADCFVMTQQLLSLVVYNVTNGVPQYGASP